MPGHKVRSIAACAAVIAASCATTSTAHAYRPFDGTDADVAAPGEFELELGPLHYIGAQRAHYVYAPVTILNLGLVRGVELVVDFKNVVALDRVPGETQVRLLDTDVLLKWVVRRGCLQEGTGPSVALEFGPLTPTTDENRFGASMLAIASQSWSTGAVHWNQEVQYRRSGSFSLFEGVIIEGSHALVVRPVAEFFVEREFGELTKFSALAGAIWQAREGLDLDAGLRVAREGDTPVGEIRLGFTWVFDVWTGQTEPVTGHGRLRRGARGSWARR